MSRGFKLSTFKLYPTLINSHFRGGTWPQEFFKLSQVGSSVPQMLTASDFGFLGIMLKQRKSEISDPFCKMSPTSRAKGSHRLGSEERILPMKRQRKDHTAFPSPGLLCSHQKRK